MDCIFVPLHNAERRCLHQIPEEYRQNRGFWLRFPSQYHLDMDLSTKLHSSYGLCCHFPPSPQQPKKAVHSPQTYLNSKTLDLDMWDDADCNKCSTSCLDKNSLNSSTRGSEADTTCDVIVPQWQCVCCATFDFGCCSLTFKTAGVNLHPPLLSKSVISRLPNSTSNAKTRKLQTPSCSMREGSTPASSAICFSTSFCELSWTESSTVLCVCSTA